MRAAHIVIPALIVAIAACADLSPGPEEAAGANMNRYVAIGSSLSMGVESDGVTAASQRAAWPAVMAADAGLLFGLPLIGAPGCKPPLAAPLANFRRVDNSAATDNSTCSPNEAGFTLPEQNVAISGATAANAVTTTIAQASNNPLYARVLATGQTQLSAMRSMNPTFVSVELGANELLPALNGLVSAATPVNNFTSSYNSVVTGVRNSGAQALLALLPTDVRKFPSVRTAAEIAAQRTAFAGRNVTVNANCNTSTNYVTIHGKVLPTIVTAAVRAAAGLGPLDLSCDNVPNQADGVLTEADMTALNAQVAQMNTFILDRASTNGYATFSLGALYDVAKDGVAFDLNAVLTSNTPFGTLISLDGIHPTAAGQRLLATAARSAIIQTYGEIIR